MKILTRRNAMLGWATWKAAKGIAKYQKAKKAVPTPKKKTSKKKQAGKILAGTAAAVGVTALVKKSKRRHHHAGGDAPGTSGE